MNNRKNENKKSWREQVDGVHTSTEAERVAGDSQVDHGGKRQMKQHKRLWRHIEKRVDAYVWKYQMLWGQSKEDICEKAYEAVWEKGARTPGQADEAIYAALSEARDESKANRARLEPYQARKAEKKVRDGLDEKLRTAEEARQDALQELVDDMAAFSQRSSCRDFDMLRVRKAVKALDEADQAFLKDFKECGSISAVAEARGIAPTSFRRDFWEGFKARFLKAWEEVDVEKLARMCSSNPYAFAGR